MLHVEEMDVFIGMYARYVYIDGKRESTLKQDSLKIQMRTILGFKQGIISDVTMD